MLLLRVHIPSFTGTARQESVLSTGHFGEQVVKKLVFPIGIQLFRSEYTCLGKRVIESGWIVPGFLIGSDDFHPEFRIDRRGCPSEFSLYQADVVRDVVLPSTELDIVHGLDSNDLAGRCDQRHESAGFTYYRDFFEHIIQPIDHAERFEL